METVDSYISMPKVRSYFSNTTTDWHQWEHWSEWNDWTLQELLNNHCISLLYFYCITSSYSRHMGIASSWIKNWWHMLIQNISYNIFIIWLCSDTNDICIVMLAYTMPFIVLSCRERRMIKLGQKGAVLKCDRFHTGWC